jgi:hypothetical protein
MYPIIALALQDDDPRMIRWSMMIPSNSAVCCQARIDQAKPDGLAEVEAAAVLHVINYLYVSMYVM